MGMARIVDVLRLLGHFMARVRRSGVADIAAAGAQGPPRPAARERVLGLQPQAWHGCQIRRSAADASHAAARARLRECARGGNRLQESSAFVRVRVRDMLSSCVHQQRGTAAQILPKHVANIGVRMNVAHSHMLRIGRSRVRWVRKGRRAAAGAAG